MLNIAHRGYSDAFAENTLLAFDEGMKAGADGFECDIRLSADGKLVVFHDDTLDRLCGVKGSVETSLWSDLQKLKVMHSEPIPSLEEVLTSFFTTRMNLEIKPSSRSAVVVEEILRLLAKIRPKGEILFSSFQPEVLEHLLTMDPESQMGKRGILVETSHLEDLPKTLDWLKPHTWNAPRQVLSAPWHQRWAGIQIPPMWLWTLNEADEWEAALASSLPIQALITNKPRALAEFLSARSVRNGRA